MLLHQKFKPLIREIYDDVVEVTKHYDCNSNVVIAGGNPWDFYNNPVTTKIVIIAIGDISNLFHKTFGPSEMAREELYEHFITKNLKKTVEPPKGLELRLCSLSNFQLLQNFLFLYHPYRWFYNGTIFNIDTTCDRFEMK